MKTTLWTIAIIVPWAAIALVIWINLANMATDCQSITAAGVAMCR